MDINNITATVTGIKAAGDIVKSLIESKISSDVRGAINELQTQLFTATSNAASAIAEQTAMNEEILSLKKEIKKIKAWNIEKKCYKLSAPWQGAVVYAVKKSMSNELPPHWICTNCYEDGRKSIITQQKIGSGYLKFMCPKCDLSFDSIKRYPHGFPFEYVQD